MMTEAILPDEVPEHHTSAHPRERRRMASAILASGLIHAGILALLIALWAPIPQPPPPLPIPVTLQEGNGASGAIGGGSGETAASASSAASESTTPHPADAPAPQPAEAVAPQQAETPTAAPPTEAPPKPAEMLAETSRDAAEPVPPKKPTPPHPPQAAAPVQAPALPQQAAAPPAPAGPATATPNASSTAIASTDAPPESGVGGRGQGTEGAGRAAVGDGSLNGLGDDYLEKVRRWLGRYKKESPEADQKKQYGTSFVLITIDRAGNVLDAKITKSSGYPLRDDATLAMVHNASPLPKVPDSYAGDQLKMELPTTYRPDFFNRLFN